MIDPLKPMVPNPESLSDDDHKANLYMANQLLKQAAVREAALLGENQLLLEQLEARPVTGSVEPVPETDSQEPEARLDESRAHVGQTATMLAIPYPTRRSRLKSMFPIAAAAGIVGLTAALIVGRDSDPETKKTAQRPATVSQTVKTPEPTEHTTATKMPRAKAEHDKPKYVKPTPKPKAKSPVKKITVAEASQPAAKRQTAIKQYVGGTTVKTEVKAPKKVVKTSHKKTQSKAKAPVLGGTTVNTKPAKPVGGATISSAQ